MSEVRDIQAFQALIDFLRQHRGFDFTGYKPNSLMRRVKKRMQMVGVEGFSDYQDYLEVHPDEFAYLFNTILINVTAFFRDPPAWDFLSSEVIPTILANKPADQPIRVWSAGCASGEEAYSLAIILAEALGLEQFLQRVKIYATDVDEDALSRARQASFAPRDLEAVPLELRGKYFELSGNCYIFRSEPRRAVIFGRLDLIQDAPISRLDLLVCRNTLMYFNAETQGKILARFHFALNDAGFLFLGKAEMLLTHANLFTPVNLTYRIFAKVSQPNLRNHLPLLTQTNHPEAVTLLTRHVRLREVALDAVPTAQLAIDLHGILVLANAQARALLGLSSKDLGRPFRDLEVSYRPIELRSLIDEVIASRRPSVLREVEWAGAANEGRYFEVQITPLLDNGGTLVGVGGSFNDVTRYRRLQEELQRSHQELETAYEELQSTNEELQSTVEELETTNEELQSTNEEMETMNEELQSTNGELQTTNEELRQRTDELNRVNGFLESILTSIRTGVIGVDQHLKITAWNRRAEDLWGLRAEEVREQFFLNLDCGLPVEQLKTVIRAVLAGEAESQEVVVEATTRRGKTIQCRVTCTPLLGRGKAIQGAVLLMEEWEGVRVNGGEATAE